MRVLELMRAHVIKAAPDTTIRDALDLLDVYQVIALPVVDDGDHVLGVVTEHDIVELLLPEYPAGGREPQSGEPPSAAVDLAARVRDRQVVDVMSTPAITVDEDADVLEAVSLMQRTGAKRIPVTSHGKLAGTVGRVDICQAILEGQMQ